MHLILGLILIVEAATACICSWCRELSLTWETISYLGEF
jgi:hypothetical protein